MALSQAPPRARGANFFLTVYKAAYCADITISDVATFSEYLADRILSESHPSFGDNRMGST